MTANEESMAPELLVAYASVAAADATAGRVPVFAWALDEAATLLEAEHLRLKGGSARTPSASVVALSNSLGPVLELSDLVLRAARSGDQLTDLDESEQLGKLLELADDLRAASEGDVGAATRVAGILELAKNFVLGRVGQPDLV